MRRSHVTSEELIDRVINFAARVGKVVDALPDTRMGELFDECNQLCNIIAQSIVTAKKQKEKKA
jgi:hypothetical protein